MSEAAPPSRARRARLYFRLMDLVFIFGLLGFTEFLLDKVGGIILIPMDNPIHPTISAIFVFLNFILPVFLVAARFMRDEYAEQLWMRTARIFVYMAAAMPLALLCAGWLAYLTSAPGSPFYDFFLLQQQVYVVIVVIWMAFMLLFVGIFQFLRWRDSR